MRDPQPPLTDEEDEGITAYHGSPHSFDRFDMSKVGIGEGAQSFGHGLYFAESEPVAKSYRDKLSSGANNWSVDGQSLGKLKSSFDDLDQVKYDIGAQMRYGRNWDEAIDYLKKDYEGSLKSKFVEPENIDMFKNRLEMLEGLRGKPLDVKQDPGHMYEVRIKAKPEHFLDWDKPFDEQSDYVKESLMAMPGFAQRSHYRHGPMGRLIKQGLLPNTYDHTDPSFSKAYLDAGIKGIRYLDQSSRGKGEGTRNYVVFDDKLVNTKRKYDKGGLVDDDDPMNRAQEQGFTQDLYHATSSTIPFKRFNSVPGFQAHDLPGVHVGSLKAAHDRAEDYFGVKDWSKAQSNESINESQAPSIMPLKGRLEKAFVKKSGEPYSESELGRKVKEFAKKAGITRPISSREPQRAFAKYLISQGYDHVPYVNSIEDKGNLSYIVLNPSKNIRSRFASFDPEKANLETDLMAKRGGSITKSGRIKRNTGGRIPEMDKLFKRAKKYVDEQTKPMLNLHDDVIVKALNLAKKKV